MPKSLSAKYYEENKERLQKSSRKISLKIFLKKNNKNKQQHGHGLYENLSEDKKQKLVDYRKIKIIVNLETFSSL